MAFRLVRGDKSDRAQFCSKISWDFDTERGRPAFVARLIGLANETECRIIGAVENAPKKAQLSKERREARRSRPQGTAQIEAIALLRIAKRSAESVIPDFATLPKSYSRTQVIIQPLWTTLDCPPCPPASRR